ncbi:MAG: hypothetical protein QFY14_02865 [Candidatus Phytoplasma pruni]|nr:hypothetical protein [Candidatus Phytoplasma pruni]MDW3618007.1 hypothetical protein [Candidatus Phytoplasma pruni]
MVDPVFGDWDNIAELKKQYYLMFDFMINHISKESVMYKDFQQNHENSKYNNFFLRWEKILD